MSSSKFYDDYLKYQVESGINDRIYGLYKRTLKTGINNDALVLEIGCGIGALTFLLSKKITTGRIEAIDLSPKSIAYAKENVRAENIQFCAGNILEYMADANKYDRILLFDVLEHIPLDKHEKLFRKAGGWF